MSRPVRLGDASSLPVFDISFGLNGSTESDSVKNNARVSKIVAYWKRGDVWNWHGGFVWERVPLLLYYLNC